MRISHDVMIANSYGCMHSVRVYVKRLCTYAYAYAWMYVHVYVHVLCTHVCVHGRAGGGCNVRVGVVTQRTRNSWSGIDWFDLDFGSTPGAGQATGSQWPATTRIPARPWPSIQARTNANHQGRPGLEIIYYSFNL